MVDYRPSIAEESKINPGVFPLDRHMTVWYKNGSTKTLYPGMVVVWATGDNTFDDFTNGPGADVDVPAAANEANAMVIAGIVTAVKDGADGGWIDIAVPRAGDLVVLAAAAGIDAGDGVYLTATEGYFADSGAAVNGDLAVALACESYTDNDNNPYMSTDDAKWVAGTNTWGYTLCVWRGFSDAAA